jgi:hypothetical protein
MALGFAIAVAHMGNAPAAARLSIVSIRTAGLINTLWAVLIAGAGTLALTRGGNAAEAMSIWLGAHLVSATLVLVALWRRGARAAGLLAVAATATGTAVLLAALAALRAETASGLGAAGWTAAMLGLGAAALVLLGRLGRRHGWLPRSAGVLGFFFGALRSLLARMRPTRGAHA